MFPLGLETIFLLFRKDHVDNAGACQSYYKICVYVIFSIISLSLARARFYQTHTPKRVILADSYTPLGSVSTVT